MFKRKNKTATNDRFETVSRGRVPGTTIQDVNRLLSQFEQMKKMIKQLSGGGKRRKKGMMGLPF